LPDVAALALAAVAALPLAVDAALPLAVVRLELFADDPPELAGDLF
jgi:hypothetical protein